MIDKDKSYWINRPVFLKFKDRFDFKKFERVRELKKVFLTERIVEMPFVIDALQGIDKKYKVLDVGCSESSLPLHMSSLGYDVTGIDIRDYPYKMPNFNFLKADIMNLPFEDGDFDAVTCVSTLEHVGLGFYSDPKEKDEPQKKAVKEMDRVLKKGGLFILTVPFGVPSVNDQQRVFDQKGVDDILEGFKIIRIKYFANFEQEEARNNYWRGVDIGFAEKVISDASTQCICCVSAQK
ncbi:MAG: class I SAM-dependent methyltransferase [Candidatus Omnitrophica bacterium]|nr:class I SAM-dependent methyltransferase [Candidatus Omnitrophota bacterium]MBU1996594.1 class I SAM-dependent methyltransferase [Candidatus Omnitrophota bacterium]